MRKVKLAWEDQIKMKAKNREDIIGLNQTEQHQSREAKIHHKSIRDDAKKLDDYDNYIIEKALFNLKIESEKHSSKAENATNDDKNVMDYHEQFFS